MSSGQFAEEIIRINKVTNKNKLGKSIVKKVLEPILRQIDEDYDSILDWIGRFIVNKLKENILLNEPSGIVYKVVLAEEGSGPQGGKYVEIGEYTASAPGEPPASFNSGLGVPTGTLFESISFELQGSERVRVGIFNSKGTEYQSLFYRGGKIFVTDSGGRSTPVQVYADALDMGASSDGWSVSPRPWFREQLNELRPVIRSMIKEQLNNSFRRAQGKTEKVKMYFRVYFEEKERLEAVGDEDW